MNKIASMTLDIVDLVLNEQIDKVAEIIEPLSEQTKVAYIPSWEEQQGLDDRKVALVLWHPNVGTFHKFAMHTPELVEINMACLVDKMSELPEEVIKVAATNLTTAARGLKVPVPEALSSFKAESYTSNTVDMRTLEMVMSKEASLENEGSANIDKFAWVEEKQYPLHTSINVKKAASYFDQEHTKMAMTKKLEFVTNTMEAATELNVPLYETTLEKYASLNSEEFSPDFYDHIIVRKSYLKESDTEKLAEYDELLRTADELGVVKTAEALEALDISNHLHTLYGQGIEDALMSTMGVVKEASSSIDGTPVTLNQLHNIPGTELTGIVGNDGIAPLHGDEGLEVLASLPKPMRIDILELIDA